MKNSILKVSFARSAAVSYGMLLLVVLATIALPVISYNLKDVVVLGSLPSVINHQILYQSVTLILALLILLISYMVRKDVFLRYFRKGDAGALIKAEPYVGIRPKPGVTWSRAGMEWALVISAVTSVVIYIQLYGQSTFTVDALLKALPVAFLFAIVNSFVEESVTRLGVVIALKDLLPDRGIAILSGLIFGLVHYFGNPGGIVGVLVAGFLGWFLAKSILETKGIFWAWFIHFLQDVIIMTAMFSV